MRRLIPIVCLLLIAATVFICRGSSVVADVPSPSVTVNVTERFADKLLFNIVSDAATPLITQTTFHYSLDGTNWLTYSIPETPSATPVSHTDFGYGFSNAPYSGVPSSQTILYKGSVTYKDGDSTATVQTSVKSITFNPLPAISISKQQFIDGVRLTITINPNYNTIISPTLYYNVIGPPPETAVALDASNRIAANTYEVDIPYDYPSVSFYATLQYPDSTGKNWLVTSTSDTASLRQAPSISVATEATDTSDIALSLNMTNYGNPVNDLYISYSTPLQSGLKAYGDQVAHYEYSYLLEDIGPATEISYYGVLKYETLEGIATLQTGVKSAATRALPTVNVQAADIDFNSIQFENTVYPNANGILVSKFFYRLAGSSDWLTQEGAYDGSYAFTLSGFAPGSTIEYRTLLSWSVMNGGESRYSDIQSIRSYQCRTRDDYFHWQYFAGANTGDLRVFADVVIYKGNPGDVSHLDKGFVWSEKAGPNLTTANKVSCGSTDTPAIGVEMSAVLSGLVIGKTYYYRAYVIQDDGTAFYGSPVRFVTFMTDVGLYIPVISPGAVIYPTVPAAASPTPAQTAEPTPAISGSNMTPAASPAPTDGTTASDPSSAATEGSTATSASAQTTDPYAAPSDGDRLPMSASLIIPLAAAAILIAGALAYWFHRRQKGH